MRTSKRWPEFILIALVLLASVLGFWEIYFGAEADPAPRHHAHLVTTFGWTFLVAAQLWLVSEKRYAGHRKLGTAVLALAPLLVATTAVLTVISANRGLESGQGDDLLVQNVMMTFELGLLIVIAFFVRKKRELHGSLLLSTLLIFGGIASFFALMSFVPQFRIEGPEIFYRFGLAAMTAQFLWLGIGLALFALRPRTNWPFLLVGLGFFLNGLIDSALQRYGLIDPLLHLVGSSDLTLTFAATLSIVLLLLILAMRGSRFAGAARRPA